MWSLVDSNGSNDTDSSDRAGRSTQKLNYNETSMNSMDTGFGSMERAASGDGTGETENSCSSTGEQKRKDMPELAYDRSLDSFASCSSLDTQKASGRSSGSEQPTAIKRIDFFDSVDETASTCDDIVDALDQSSERKPEIRSSKAKSSR